MSTGTIFTLEEIAAQCKVVAADSTGKAVFTVSPSFINGEEEVGIGGGGYFPGKGIIIGDDITSEVDNQIIIGDGAKASTNADCASIAIGNSADSSGGFSIAIGCEAKANNTYTIAIGDCAKASGCYSTALGVNACAEDDRSTALGFAATASGCQSTALGVGTTASGKSSTALGVGTKASGYVSTALGHSANASGGYSTALGYFACATEDGSTALGYLTQATGYGALAIGHLANAGENEIVIKSINEANTACNYFKVSSDSVLTLNNQAAAIGHFQYDVPYATNTANIQSESDALEAAKTMFDAKEGNTMIVRRSITTSTEDTPAYYKYTNGSWTVYTPGDGETTTHSYTEDTDAKLAMSIDEVATDIYGTDTPTDGDTIEVKKIIAPTDAKYSYTAYIYKKITVGTEEQLIWQPLDGNYSASNVYFEDDIVATYAFGKYVPSTGKTCTVPTKGKSVEDVFQTALSVDQQPTITKPSATLTASAFKTYEVGETTGTLSFSATLNPGSYNFGPSSTGVTAQTYTTTSVGSTALTGGTNLDKASGSFSAITVTDTTSAQIKTSITHSASTVNALTRLGKDSGKSIAAGTVTKNSGTITGVRYSFYGIYENEIKKGEEEETITSAVIRGLEHRTTSALNGKSVPVGGARAFIIAIPRQKPTGAKGNYNVCDQDYLSKILDENDSSSNLATQFTKMYVEVADATGENNKIQYSVYYKLYASALATNNYIITQ